MEHQEILNLFNEPNNSKFMIRKWNIVNDTSKANYVLQKLMDQQWMILKI